MIFCMRLGNFIAPSSERTSFPFHTDKGARYTDSHGDGLPVKVDADLTPFRKLWMASSVFFLGIKSNCSDAMHMLLPIYSCMCSAMIFSSSLPKLPNEVIDL